MLDWKRKLAMMAVPAVLAVGATAVIAHATGTPAASSKTNVLLATTPSTATPATEAPGTTTEGPEATTPETVEANEPALPGGGHSDPAGQVDHQFEGTE